MKHDARLGSGVLHIAFSAGLTLDLLICLSLNLCVGLSYDWVYVIDCKKMDGQNSSSNDWGK